MDEKIKNINNEGDNNKIDFNYIARNNPVQKSDNNKIDFNRIGGKAGTSGPLVSDTPRFVAPRLQSKEKIKSNKRKSR